MRTAHMLPLLAVVSCCLGLATLAAAVEEAYSGKAVCNCDTAVSFCLNMDCDMLTSSYKCKKCQKGYMMANGTCTATEVHAAAIAGATDAFLWAYPLVNTAPNFISNGFTQLSDMNTFKMQYIPNNSSFNSIVSPNVNVLYGPAFIDLTKGPMVISVPNFNGRYYVLQMMNYWGLTFDRIGFSTTGTWAGKYLLSGPSNYAGISMNIPAVDGTYQSQTFGVWIMARFEMDPLNQTDISVTNELQDAITITPVVPGSGNSTTIFDETMKANDLWSSYLSTGNAKNFWDAFNILIVDNPILEYMEQYMTAFALLGVTKNGVKWNKLNDRQKNALQIGAQMGWAMLLDSSNPNRVIANSSSTLITYTGWATSPMIGAENNTIWNAALVSYAYVAANIPAEAIYWNGQRDNCGSQLMVGNSYVLNVTSKPPYRAFWSVTTYNSTNFFLMNTTDDLYAIGNQNTGLKLNAAGGAVLYLSQNKPTDAAKASNWLPLATPTSESSSVFYLLFRIYSPTSADVINWYAPAVIRRVDSDFNPEQCP